MLDALNAAVSRVATLRPVEFAPGLHEGAYRWLAKKHAGGMRHEPAAIAGLLALSNIRPVQQIYDIGALYGYFTKVCQQIRPEAHILAVDMHPAGLSDLHANVNANYPRSPGVECLNVAISDVCRPAVKFWISGFNIFEEPEAGWDALPDIPGAMKQRGANNQGRGFAEVNFATIDAITALSSRKPDVIKIDVEGYQGKAVAGMVETLKAFRPAVIVELHDPEKLARFGITNRSTVQPLFDLGYSGYWCGNFRDMDARFEAVTYDGMDERHERLSMMVFA